jgi:spore coat polysaccharide biosynthesis protein SpsF (cytidylyltransferase family)
MGALAIVQARMSSTRLPGKVLMDVGGEPLLALLLRRLAHAKHVERTVVATSDRPEDDEIEGVAGELGVGVHRGPLEDVLGRVAGAAAGHDGAIVRLTADCPLIDPGLVDSVVEMFGAAGVSYASNVEPRTFPDGLDVEVVSSEALAEADETVSDPVDREHVTTAIRRDPVRFPAVHLVNDENLGELRWTVDDAEDLEFVRSVVERLGERRHTAGMAEILELVGG